MARFEVFIPAALESEFNVTLKVDADNWMAALKQGLKKLGDQGANVVNILVDIMDDNSIHVTDSVGGRVFRIKELAELPAARAAEPRAVEPMPAAKIAAPAKPAEPVKPAAPAKPVTAAPPSAPRPAAPPTSAKVAAPKPAAPPPAAPTPAPAPKPAAPQAAAPAPKLAAPAAAATWTKPSEGEARTVEQVVAPTQPVNGPIGREHNPGRAEDLLGDLFERVAEIDSYDRAKAMAFLLDLAMEAIPADAGSVFISDVSTPELTIACARGPKARELEAMKLRMPMGVGIVGFCAQEAVSLAISDTEKDPRFHREVSQKIGYPTKSILCAPMVVSGRTYGCLEIINKKGSSHFGDSELGALAYLAHQGARYLERRG